MTEPVSIDRLTGIIAFARAGQLGSYRAAARTLGISPSAISKSVQRLESRLGVRLFNRTTRSLTLTREGRDLHEHALRLLGEAEVIEQMALAARGEPAGMLKVTAALPIGLHILGPSLPAFIACYPRVSIDLRLSDTIADLVEEGIDVAIRVGPLIDSRIIARRLCSNRVCAYASPGYLERRGIPGHPDELKDHDCVNVRFQSSGQPLRWPFRIGEQTIEIDPPARIVVDSSDAVATIVANGGGIGMSPTYVAAGLVERGLLVPVLTEYSAVVNDITALWLDSRRHNPVVRAFVAFLAQRFQSKDRVS